MFMSSVAVVQSWPLSQGKVPEDIKLEPKFVVGPGYGEAKYVAEQVRTFNIARRISPAQDEVNRCMMTNRSLRKAVFKRHLSGLDKSSINHGQ
jgi:hypothetical protein